MANKMVDMEVDKIAEEVADMVMDMKEFRPNFNFRPNFWPNLEYLEGLAWKTNWNILIEICDGGTVSVTDTDTDRFYYM